MHHDGMMVLMAKCIPSRRQSREEAHWQHGRQEGSVELHCDLPVMVLHELGFLRMDISDSLHIGCKPHCCWPCTQTMLLTLQWLSMCTVISIVNVFSFSCSLFHYHVLCTVYWCDHHAFGVVLHVHKMNGYSHRHSTWGMCSMDTSSS